ncbi:hypothetical protein CLV28_0714 [Sediminihabitans luteus]|uniref:DUF7426 domain-containing protein n=1 Tax=Sediminihabitans luteus TaxID=1138585 RepID=A0A2M9D086_9CELL|nr:hypothetical protein [Sediminihabitans luteus]PJJ77495.1 hypothetical protein CLV28_0714 [Sediminihabitans luteus]GII98392.1 hypothetical protein Slu03_07700 [Sediminihabitans luteus]
MPKFADLGDLLTEGLTLTAAGVTITVPSPPARVGLRLQALWAGDTDHDYTSREAYRRDILSDRVYDQLIAADVGLPVLEHIVTTALVWHCVGAEAAAVQWQAPAGKAPAREASTPTAEASTTPTPGSTSGTRTRQRTSSRKPPAKAPAGPTSSTTGP